MHDYRTDERLRKQERLRDREEFLDTREHGVRETSEHFVIYARPNGRAYNRLGMTASTKVGPATIRNWWKRRIREAFRQNKQEVPGGLDFVVIVKASSDRAPYAQLRDELVDVLNRSAEVTESV